MLLSRNVESPHGRETLLSMFLGGAGRGSSHGLGTHPPQLVFDNVPPEGGHLGR